MPHKIVMLNCQSNMKRIWLLVLGCLIACIALAATVFADLDKGMKAYENKDFKTAFSEFKKAAELGDARSQYMLAVMYDNGEGTPVNKAEALKWYKKAADQGDAAAQHNLTVMYYNGEGTPVNKAEAFKWYKKAAEQGEANAQNNLAFMYNKGEGTPVNKAEALKWYNKAAEQGFELAKEALKKIQ